MKNTIVALVVSAFTFAAPAHAQAARSTPDAKIDTALETLGAITHASVRNDSLIDAMRVKGTTVATLVQDAGVLKLLFQQRADLDRQYSEELDTIDGWLWTKGRPPLPSAARSMINSRLAADREIAKLSRP